jgi:succinate dehydrogenase / fumarate reductase flavoprotein subunit
MRIFPAMHYTMGGLWVDYFLMSTIPGLFVIGEANFSDHGANRLGASALMQGLSDGYFILPYTVGDYLVSAKPEGASTEDAAFAEAEQHTVGIIQRLMSARGRRTVDSFHKQLGKILWEDCGMARNARGLERAIGEIRELREEYWNDVKVLGGANELNQALEKAGRVADFFELAELLSIDALERRESCGGHFRDEYQTPDGEAQRNDAEYSYAAAWEYQGPHTPAALHKEPLEFEYVHPSQRSYK